MIIHKEIISLTPSSGSATTNTNKLLVGILRQVLCSPTTPTTIYDITITSPEGLIIYQTTSQTGDLADDVTLPMRGIHTVALANSTVDEVFNINLVVDESHS